MTSTREIEPQIAFESARRARLAVPAVAGGVLYLLSGIILSATLSALPTAGLVQGLSPAINGEANPVESPRAAEVKYIDHHAFGLIAGSVLTAIAVVFLTLVLVFLADVTRFRRPESWPAARPLVLVGGIGVALLNVIHEAVLAVEAHSFATGSDLTNKAVDRALLTTGSAGVILGLAGLLAALALAVGMIAVMVGSMRAGLLPRWLSVLGILSGLLFLPLFGTTTLQLVPTFWLVATGILLMGRWPGGDPPAWAAGEARPWPTQAELCAKRGTRGEAVGQQSGGAVDGWSPGSKDARAERESAVDVAPAPTPAGSGSRRKRRKRG